MKQKEIGKAAFETYYASLFSDPSQAIQFFHSLTTKNKPVLLFDPQNEIKLKTLWQEQGLSCIPLPWFPHAYLWPEEVPLNTPLPGYTEHLFYPLNASSLIPVLALNPKPGEYILDACAAPGGKSLAIANLLGDSHTLVANDLSRQRRDRMKAIFTAHKKEIAVWGMMAELVCKRSPEAFDKILLDAPCSSEAHIYTTPAELSKWSRNRITSLKKRQVGLLGGLWHALKPGGILVYSTCAVTPEENEWVVATFLKKKKGEAVLLPWSVKCPGAPGMSGDYPQAVDLNSVRRISVTEGELGPMFVVVLQKSGAS